MDEFWLILIIQSVVFGKFCSYIAKEKNRDSSDWFWLGFFFSFIALLALIAVPKVEKNEEQNEYEESNENLKSLLIIFLGIAGTLLFFIFLIKFSY